MESHPSLRTSRVRHHNPGLCVHEQQTPGTQLLPWGESWASLTQDGQNLQGGHRVPLK